MPERANETIKVAHGEGGGPIYVEEIFPKCSLLEISFRIRPLENSAITEIAEELRVAFGEGVPPDFGLGNTNVQVLHIPAQLAGLKPWETELADNQAKLTAMKVGLEAEITQRSNLVGILELVEENEPGNYTALFNARAGVAAIEGAIADTEVAIKEQEALIIRIEREKPSGWSDFVNGSFDRVYDAVRIELALLKPRGTLAFELEYTLIVSRPEDIGPTYTESF